MVLFPCLTEGDNHKRNTIIQYDISIKILNSDRCYEDNRHGDIMGETRLKVVVREGVKRECLTKEVTPDVKLK